MHSRAGHATWVTVAVASLQVAAALGRSPVPALAYLAAVALGGVVFLQGERRAVPEPVFVTLGVGFALGTVLSLCVASGLLTAVLGVPWDLSLWRMALLLWDSWVGLAVTVVSTFFVAGVVSSLR